MFEQAERAWKNIGLEINFDRDKSAWCSNACARLAKAGDLDTWPELSVNGRQQSFLPESLPLLGTVLTFDGRSDVNVETRFQKAMACFEALREW